MKALNLKGHNLPQKDYEDMTLGDAVKCGLTYERILATRKDTNVKNHLEELKKLYLNEVKYQIMHKVTSFGDKHNLPYGPNVIAFDRIYHKSEGVLLTYIIVESESFNELIEAKKKIDKIVGKLNIEKYQAFTKSVA